MEEDILFSSYIYFEDENDSTDFLETINLLNDSTSKIFQSSFLIPGYLNSLQRLESMIPNLLRSIDEEHKDIIKENEKSEEIIYKCANVIRSMMDKKDNFSRDEISKISFHMKNLYLHIMSLMKSCEKQQAKEILDVVKVCEKTIEDTINSPKKNALTYLSHIKGYIEDNLLDLLNNWKANTVDSETELEISDIIPSLKKEWNTFHTYISKLWPTLAGPNAQSQESLEKKKDNSKKLRDIFQNLTNRLNGILSLDIFFHLNDYQYISRYLFENSLENFTDAIVQGSTKSVVEEGKIIKMFIDQIEKKNLDQNIVVGLKNDTANLFKTSKILLQNNDPNSVSQQTGPIFRNILSKITSLQILEVKERKKYLFSKKIYGKLPNSVQQLSLNISPNESFSDVKNTGQTLLATKKTTSNNNMDEVRTHRTKTINEYDFNFSLAFCDNCGEKVDKSENFCGNCGEKVNN